MPSDIVVAARLGIASLVGLAAGLEREWSGHASGADARFAGIRTFFLLGVVGGIAGTFADASFQTTSAALALGACALCVSAYVMTVRRPGTSTDGTTEVAAMATVALGVLAGAGRTAIAAGAGAVAVLMLREKSRLHSLVARLAEPDLRAGLQFAVLAVVVLPLLPAGPFLGPLAVMPRMLWEIVLLFSALNFVGFVARRTLGASHGLGVTGALGGVVSSTAVTLDFSRQARAERALAAPLSQGVLAACTVLVPRVLLVSAVLNQRTALALIPLLLPAFLIGAAFVAVGWRSRDHAVQAAPVGETNPLQLGAAVRMTIVFQIAMVAIELVRRHWGAPGVFASAAALGLTDVDALTVSMSRPEAGLDASIAAHAIAIGVIANTITKLAIVIVFGRSAYRRRAAAGLASIAAGTAIGLIIG